MYSGKTNERKRRVLDLFSPFTRDPTAAGIRGHQCPCVYLYIYISKVSKGSREHIELCASIYILIYTYTRRNRVGSACVYTRARYLLPIVIVPHRYLSDIYIHTHGQVCEAILFIDGSARIFIHVYCRRSWG